MGFHALTAGTDIYIDWCFVRKYVSPEPTHTSFGDQESGFCTLTINSTPIQGIPFTIEVT
jgi:hypothetical protein